MSSVLPLRGSQAGLPTARSAATPARQSHLAQRPDVDGLRGVAVLSVLAVHSFPQWLKGGFIGVDIFFVLSGFLITGVLLQSLESGRFSYLDFYRRRVRRILPALCLVLSATLAAGVLFTFPYETRRLGAHVEAGALFISNFTLWQEAGYFDVSSEAKPLLHLWSLGIEEQFYLVWPVAVVLLFKLRRWALWLICGALLASFFCNVYYVGTKPSATFFLPPTRFWELMTGALLADLTQYHGGGPVAWLKQRVPAASWLHRRMADGLAAMGLAMLGVALWMIDKTDHFPGWWALLPTGGTFALLAAGPGTWVNRQLLSQPILRFYGAISYPLYLWHWPLLSFPVIMGIPLTHEVRVMILIASVVLAALTYELLEKPIRFGRLAGPRTPLLLCLSLCFVGLGGWVVMKTDGLLNTYPESVRGIAAAQLRFDYAEYRVDKCMARLHQGPEIFTDECIDLRDSTRKLLFIWGDSHAASLYPGLAKLVRDDEKGYRLAQFTAAACPPLLMTPSKAAAPCQRTNAYILQRIAEERPATVLMAAHWKLYGTEPGVIDAHMENLRETVRHLKSLGVQRVVVFGHLPTWTIAQPNLLLRQWQQTGSLPERSSEYLDQASLSTDKIVENALTDSGAVYVSPIAQLCNASGCLVSTHRHGLYHSVTNDDNHLTTYGSELLIERSRAAVFNGAGLRYTTPYMRLSQTPSRL
ncbi:MAG TPA: acyltransferase family protein [Rhizobacter sp.]|nr:acyltransferase family protein [Rhizobacter sp.]